MHVFSIGEMLIDFLPGDEEGTYIRKFGGAPANVAVALSRQGVSASFCGLVGNDDFGRFLNNTLIENNVKVCLRQMTDNATTTMAFVSLDEKGDRSFTFARKPGADMLLTREMIEDSFMDEADIVHAGSCSLSEMPEADATIYALKKASENGKTVSFDVNYRDLMWNNDYARAKREITGILPYVDYLKVSDEELDFISDSGDIEKTMEKNSISLVVVTMGEKGAKCYFKGKTITVEGIKGKCVDSCGAGDAFWGGFLAGLIKNGVMTVNDLNESIVANALRRANICGFLCIQKKGAIESLPNEKEIERFT